MENLVGIVLPPVIEVVNAKVKSDRDKFVIAVVICFIVSCLLKYQAILAGNAGDIFSLFLLVFGETMATFNLYWRNSFPRDWLQKKLGLGVIPNQA